MALIFTGAHPFAGDENVLDQTADIVRLLGKHGANPNRLTSQGERLLTLAYDKDEKDALISIGAR